MCLPEEFDRLVFQIMCGEYLSTYIAEMDDGTFKVRFACGDNVFISNESFGSIEEADVWAHERIDSLSISLGELGYIRKTDGHPN